jgi:uncharacterized protein (DUF1697 family)
MTVYVALLRAVNVGGTGKMPMADLKAMCVEAGLSDVRTYIASGNVVFSSTLKAAPVKTLLEKRLHAYAGKSVGVIIRTADELAAVLTANPFPKAAPNRTVAIFLDDAPPKDALSSVTGRKSEEVASGKREIFVHYGDGMADSKLKIPVAKMGTARNMNTVAKLVELSTKA